jgi:hypothetical protein
VHHRSEEERMGADIVMKSLRAPARIIANNAGVEGEVVVQTLLGQPFEMGYNAMTDDYVNMMEMVGRGARVPMWVRGQACTTAAGCDCERVRFSSDHSDD